jgi:hypothetical protein
MDKVEARQVLAGKIAELRRWSYTDLLRFFMEPEGLEVIGPSGTIYQLEIQALWDDKRSRHLRVLASTDDGGWRAFAPLCDDVIIAPDGSFIGK